MKFVKEHLTTHHFLHKPHRWFIAFLLSPIHALEIHYQRQYHLQFSHARKLFIFDMLLLASIFVIASAAAGWYWYDPTVEKNIVLTLDLKNNDQDLGRVRSGEFIFLTAHYQNNSLVTLTNVSARLNLPPGFILHGVSGGDFTSSTGSISLPEISPKDSREITVRGLFFGNPNQEYPTGVELVYRQKNNELYEVVTATALATARGSVLFGTLTAPETIFANSAWESQLVLTNTNNRDLNNIIVRIPSSDELSYQIKTVGLGLIEGAEKNIWSLPRLGPGQTATTTLSVQAKVPANRTDITQKITPILLINGREFPQEPISVQSNVAHPGLDISAVWNVTKLKPGEILGGTLKIKNSGSVDLKNIKITIPFPTGIVNQTLAKEKNPFPIIGSLAKNETREIPLLIPIVNYPSGPTDLKLLLSPKVTATISGITQEFSTKTDLPIINIGTSLRLIPDAHYYSAEGDQIGRGPLPPKVGKETKYWALITVQNGTSELGNVTLSAQLPTNVAWTGKTSVSRGREPIYNPNNRTFAWQINGLDAHDNAQINVELALTPTEAERNTTPLLLTNLRASGQDTFIEGPINAGPFSLDSSLKSDDFAQEKGVRVQ